MPRSLLRVAAAAQGLLLGVALGVLIADLRFVEVAAALILGAFVLVLARVVSPPGVGMTLVALVGVAFALRVAAAVLLHVGSQATGLGGFITGDDREYYVVARALVLWLQGRPEPPFVPPYWAGEAYLFGTWVYMESLIFLVVGALPLVPIFLNACLGTMSVVLTWTLTSRLFKTGPAVVASVLVAFWPSLVLWSALNLKDALALVLILSFLYAVARLQQVHRVRILLAPALVLVLMQSLRGYIFTGLALLLPIGALFAPTPARRTRLTLLVSALALSAVALGLDQAGLGLGPRLLESSESYRTGMAVGARTAFVPAPPVQVETGATFVVPGQTEQPVLRTPQIHHVPPQTRIVVGIAPAVSQPGIVHVQPADIVVVGPPETTPAPVPVTLPSAQTDLIGTRPPASGELAMRTIAYLPQGLIFSLFAPWPWLGNRPQDLLTIPEMVIWYFCLAAATLTVWRYGPDRYLIVPALFAAGTLLIFALVEGNWGTLYRHRSMVIPVVVAIASPTILAAARGRKAALAAIGRRERRATSSASLGGP